VIPGKILSVPALPAITGKVTGLLKKPACNFIQFHSSQVILCLLKMWLESWMRTGNPIFIFPEIN